ncbi:AMP-binding enzyme, partial [Mycobacterium tuberculosis]|uniref:AMP-binding enzyme n=1 Tax=Mycobacterium tuberculosis TaxID=1773 RepID=UPI001B161B21|nr:hypothetical protein [Mycobacterium tuberculosis]
GAATPFLYVPDFPDRPMEEVYPRRAPEGAAVVARDAGPVGQEPVAFVVAEEGHDVDAQSVMTFVAEKVLPYKKIRDVFTVDALPTSAAGKIQKVALREL